jgi:hypothetical protein
MFCQLEQLYHKKPLLLRCTMFIQEISLAGEQKHPFARNRSLGGPMAQSADKVTVSTTDLQEPVPTKNVVMMSSSRATPTNLSKTEKN